LEIWNTAFSQFKESPILGDKLRVDGFNGHAHNFFIEVLQTVGIVGFVPFTLLVFMVLRRSIYLYKHYPQHSWVPLIFLQTLAQHMFSGTLNAASWFWLSM